MTSSPEQWLSGFPEEGSSKEELRHLTGMLRCTRCALCANQPPVMDVPRKARVVWVGLSAVRVDDAVHTAPLAGDTCTGSVVAQVEAKLPHVQFYKTNLVKCLPLALGRIRYPSSAEMGVCFPHLQTEISALKPKVVVLLGKQVAQYVLKQAGHEPGALDREFAYQPVLVDGIAYTPIHHPAHVMVYRRRQVDDYIEQVRRLITMVLQN